MLLMMPFVVSDEAQSSMAIATKFGRVAASAAVKKSPTSGKSSVTHPLMSGVAELVTVTDRRRRVDRQAARGTLVESPKGPLRVMMSFAPEAGFRG